MSLIDSLSAKWIGNIKKLDDINHLVHGEFYAKDGSVHDFKINNNIVNAKVEGAPGKVFDVEIKFNELINIQKQKILDYIISDSMVYSQLMNNQIPDELLNMNVKILPDSLRDFKMSCSCNKGLFCKHKAAVFHKLKGEIDKDPFLLFTLIGLNLKEELGINVSQIRKIRDVLRDDDEIIPNPSGNMDFLTKLNFILSDDPSFYDSFYVNFKQVITDTLQLMSKCINQIQNPRVKDEFHEYIILGNTLRTFEFFVSKSPDEIRRAFQNKWLSPQNFNNFKVNIDGNYDIIDINTGDFENNFTGSNLKFAFFAFFAEMNQVDVSEYDDKIKYLHELYNFTAKLIYLNALIPEFFSLDNTFHHVRWIPAFENSIYSKLNDFYDRCPEDLLTFYDTRLSGKNQVNALISLFFEGFAHYYVHKFMPHNQEFHTNEFYFRLFFLKSQNFNNYQYEGREVEVNNWLSVLYLNQKDYKFTINSIQSNYEFILELKICMDDEEYSIHEILKSKKSDIINMLAVFENVFSKFDFSYDLHYPRGLDLREFNFFFDKIVPVLNELGVEVSTPPEFETVSDVKLMLNTKIIDSTASLSLDDLIDFDWKIAIGDEMFSVKEFKSFTQNYRGLVKIKDRYYVIDENNLKKLREDVSKIPKIKNKTDLLRYLLSSDSDSVEIDNKLNKLIDNVLDIKDVEVPENLNGTLRGYQKTGFSWMIQNMQLGFGSILADDMGLGKTIQLLALVLHLKENNLINNEKVLVVAPTSILTNWAKEIEKFTPSLKAEIYHGINRSFPKDDFDILLTSYGIVRQDFDDFNNFNWFLLVIDEAQNIKNPKTQQTKAIKAINASHHIALSGTPIENHMAEYWSIFDFINKGYLFDLTEFRNRFINPIEKSHDREVLEDFKKITSPFILRRLKTDRNIIKDLPDKIINDVYCNLTVKQASIYEETLNQLIVDVEDSEGIQRKGLVLKLINSLKQICNHPAQFLNSPDFKSSESGKMEVLMNILENIMENNEKVLIFTQYVKMGRILKELIEEKFSQEALFMHGGVSRTKRDEMIEEFQEGDSKIFILSLKAGGIGLNLTAASNVIHYDLWWNPAVENQATDRAYRIGQKENVMVYRFITTGTLEERINQILLGKRELVEMTIEGNESFITEMSDGELRNMLDLRGGN